MWGALLGGAFSMFAGSRAASSAERRAREAEERAIQRQREAEKRAIKAQRLERKRGLKGLRRQEAKGRKRDKREEAEYEADLAEERQYNEALAASERNQALEDEQTQFVRLRDAAQAGGFNPLTVLGAGHTGASIPTGVLSPMVGTAQRSYASSGYMASGGRSDVMALSQGAYASRIEAGRVAGELGTNAYSASSQASAAHNANTLGALSTALSFASSVDAQGLEADRLAMDRERLALDTTAVDLERQRLQHEVTQQQTFAHQIAQSTGRMAGAGGVSNFSVAAPVIGNDLPPNAVPRDPNGNVANRDLALFGGTFEVGESTSPAGYWEEEYGEVASIIGAGRAIFDIGYHVGSQWSRPAFNRWWAAREAYPATDLTDEARDTWNGDPMGLGGFDNSRPIYDD